MSHSDASHTHRLDEHAVILFDGVCNLCNGFVNFIIDRDPDGYFKFAALQSKEAQALLDGRGEDVRADADGGLLRSVVLIEGHQVYRKSTAALHVARRLTGLWPLFFALIVVPRPLRDAVYDAVAARRYDWFGQREQCRVPTPDLQSRFLETPTRQGQAD